MDARLFRLILSREVLDLVQAESAYLNEGVIPPYAPSKWHISNDAANEIEGAQEYLAALALSNLSSPGAVHGAAAFDLTSTDLHVWETGVTDWWCLWSPSQMHVWSSTQQVPLSWAHEHQMLTMSHALTPPAVTTTIAAPDEPPAIPFVLRLRGGGKRARSKIRAPDDGGGDDGDEPTTGISAARASF